MLLVALKKHQICVHVSVKSFDFSSVVLEYINNSNHLIRKVMFLIRSVNLSTIPEEPLALFREIQWKVVVQAKKEPIGIWSESKSQGKFTNYFHSCEN